MPAGALDESHSYVPLDKILELMPSEDEMQRHWKMRSIYRVPPLIADCNREAYCPQVVSFGPYHHGKDSFLPMEEHKHRVLRHFLKRSRKPIELFFESLREVARDLEESYDALDPKWKASSGEGTARRFLELMIIDGCFILEILSFLACKVHDYAPNDPIFSYYGIPCQMGYLWQDMLMLENQLPMLVLDRLVAVKSDGEKDYEYVNKLILSCCILGTPTPTLGKCLHVLDVARKSMLREPEKKNEVRRNYGPETIRLASATELSEHGIQFKRSKTKSLNDISFAGGVLTLPQIWLDGNTKSMFLNLTAFERPPAVAGIEVRSYIYCMDCIISNRQDIALLRDQGIILNFLESDEAVAKMFNSVGKDVMLDLECSLVDEFEKVNKYYNKRWNMWRANFIHTYLRNPWVTLSLIAAVFLFALTIIQTVYSVLGYHK
ncbi:hypothetical protein BT93_D1300 [Corymbia citriodora subsp. variegata]|nr:hypothetical protein BT93_D1300 [Corymbia citriodora subsp. variegata]